MTDNPRVLMVSSYEKLNALCKKVAAEKNIKLDVITKAMDKALASAREYESNDVDCIISRGPTGIYLRNQLSVPVLLIQVTAFDIMQAIHRALQVCEKLAYIDHVHRMNSYDFDAMLQLLDVKDVNRYYYCDLEMLSEQLDLASAEGVDTIVAPDYDVIEMAEQKGLRGIIVDTNYEAVAEAVGRAKELTSLLEKDHEAGLFMKAVIDNYENALIVLDENHLISHLNRAAEKMLKVASSQYVGKAISDLDGLEHELIQQLKDRKNLVNQVFNVKQHRILFNVIPLSFNGSFRGKIVTLHRVSKIQQMEAKIRRELYAKGLVARHSFDDLIGKSTAINKAISFARRYAEAESTVLITGESGTGKELFAQSIHQASQRCNGPFVSVNCAAIPENLLESELFGYSEGAFTGAKRGGKPGLFEIAHEGTLLLDEVSEIPLHLQARLLRALQEKAVRRIGDDEMTVVDVKVIASANSNLLDMTLHGKFRQDLYYRLNVLNLFVPSLRERKDDIIPLFLYFVHKFGGKVVTCLPKEAENELISYNWPGNVRELENFVERLVVLTNTNTGDKFEDVLFNLIEENLKNPSLKCLSGLQDQDQQLLIQIDNMRNMEYQIISKLKKKKNLSQEQLASELGISRTTLWSKLKNM